MPNSACSSSVIARRASFRRRRHQQHVGTVASRSNHSATSSRSTDGAKGRNDSRYLTFRFSDRLHLGRARIAENGAAAQCARTELHPSLKPAHGLAVHECLARSVSSSASVVETAKRAPAAVSRCSISACGKTGPRYEPCMASVRRRRRARLSLDVGDRRPAPRPARRRHRRRPAGSRFARTARPAAILPLATQFSATPPARQRFSCPGFARQRARQAQNDFLQSPPGWMRPGPYAAASTADPACAAGRRTALSNLSFVIVRPGAVVEVGQVQPKGAVRLQIDQVVEDLLRVFGSPYGARPISLYSPEFTLKPV